MNVFSFVAMCIDVCTPPMLPKCIEQDLKTSIKETTYIALVHKCEVSRICKWLFGDLMMQHTPGRAEHIPE